MLLSHTLHTSTHTHSSCLMILIGKKNFFLRKIKTGSDEWMKIDCTSRISSFHNKLSFPQLFLSLFKFLEIFIYLFIFKKKKNSLKIFWNHKLNFSFNKFTNGRLVECVLLNEYFGVIYCLKMTIFRIGRIFSFIKYLRENINFSFFFLQFYLFKIIYQKVNFKKKRKGLLDLMIERIVNFYDKM